MDHTTHIRWTMMGKPEKPLPFAYYYIPFLLISLGGIFASMYLSLAHYRVYTDIGYSSFCAISKAINCDTVSQSPLSIFLGLPVPIWGAWGYALFLAVAIAAGSTHLRPRRLWRILFLLSAVFSLISILLAGISSFVIHSFCVMCVVTYAVNFALLFYTYLIPSRFDPQPFIKGLSEDLQALTRRPKLLGGATAALLAALALVWLLVPAYWAFKPLSNQAGVAGGTTADGHPWIGAPEPEITIVEFADYQCFQCRKMHFHLRRLVSRYPDRIRLVHRHFPMDHQVNPLVKEPFHTGSAQMAFLALYAREEGKFWSMNDVLYQAVAQNKGDIEIKMLAEKAGIAPEYLQSALRERADLRQALMRDIREGLRLGITGTPAYVINGEVYLAQIPADILAEF